MYSMKKILNRPEDVVEEMINGLVEVHDDIVHRVGDTRVVARNYEGKGKVGLVSGGGSGHEPSHAGFVGKGMLSAAVCGDVFTSPTVDQVYEGIKAADKGAGVFLVIKNYTGDVINFEMAKEMAEENDGIKVDYVITNDDIAVEDSTWTEGRRGVAGTVLVHKICGALAENGASLEEIKEESEKLLPEMATLGLALTPAIVPQAGKPGFELAEDEIEFGIGIHGEPGYRKLKLQTSAEMAKEFYTKIKKELELTASDEVVVFVNGMGGTPLMEQYVFANDVLKLLAADNVKVAKKILGDKMTSIEMAGISLTIFRIKDKKWLELLNQEVEVIAW
jgi:phosphoenolpyruvate---glycerone phosphotransferase subunit DhaK